MSTKRASGQRVRKTRSVVGVQAPEGMAVSASQNANVQRSPDSGDEATTVATSPVTKSTRGPGIVERVALEMGVAPRRRSGGGR